MPRTGPSLLNLLCVAGVVLLIHNNQTTVLGWLNVLRMHASKIGTVIRDDARAALQSIPGCHHAFTKLSSSGELLVGVWETACKFTGRIVLHLRSYNWTALRPELVAILRSFPGHRYALGTASLLQSLWDTACTMKRLLDTAQYLATFVIDTKTTTAAFVAIKALFFVGLCKVAMHIWSYLAILHVWLITLNGWIIALVNLALWALGRVI